MRSINDIDLIKKRDAVVDPKLFHSKTATQPFFILLHTEPTAF